MCFQSSITAFFVEAVDPDLWVFLKKYVSGLMSYKGIEIKAINDYIEDRRRPMGLAESLDKIEEDGIEKGRQIPSTFSRK